MATGNTFPRYREKPDVMSRLPWAHKHRRARRYKHRFINVSNRWETVRETWHSLTNTCRCIVWSDEISQSMPRFSSSEALFTFGIIVQPEWFDLKRQRGRVWDPISQTTLLEKPAKTRKTVFCCWLPHTERPSYSTDSLHEKLNLRQYHQTPFTNRVILRDVAGGETQRTSWISFGKF